MKRFDERQHMLLKLLSKCILDDLVIYESDHQMDDETPEAFEARLIQLRESKDRQGLDAELKKIKERESYLNEMLRDDRIFFKNSISDWIDAVSDENPEFEKGFDRIFTTFRPVAYYLPEATISVINANPNLYIRKLHSLLKDLPNETGLLIVRLPDKEDFDLMFIYDLTPYGICGLILGNSAKSGKKVYVLDSFAVPMSAIKNPEKVWLPSKKPNLAAKSDAAIRAGHGVLTLTILLFIHFFEVERVIVVQPNGNDSRYKTVELNEQRYSSNLTYPVNIIDAHWFTTIIRDDPFLVSGHWRRQPYGPGRSDFKMKYIGTYQKNGYHRRAKHESETDEKISDTQTDPEVEKE
ncbi:hypothetical protein [Larkinella terrae]|uniref:Uncharacterized protein n=1 Tax=Larkinella terrae TaxID=2025311 RepID=A0A7K0EIT2_9BACT|nr:hypothetical protein [Larkinella terrae]MRS61753.1 hypothetical protein [Larkinella terrae]